VTGYSKDVKGGGSADTVIYLLGMFDLESVVNQTFSKRPRPILAEVMVPSHDSPTSWPL
jgi:hypothetical protein